MPGDELLGDGCGVIVVGNGAIAADAAEGLAAASGLHVCQATFATAAMTVRDHPWAAAALVDLRDADADEMAVLVDIIAAADDGALRLVVVFGEAQLDEVGALLLGGDSILLCEPEPCELAAALAVAVHDTALTVRDGSHEAARLQRLNEEVARFAATLARLSMRQDPPHDRVSGADPFVADRHPGFGAQPAGAGVMGAAGAIDPADIRRAIRARRMRDDAFEQPGLFEDPAWDMLLDLFAAELERRRVSVSSLCIAAAVAPTTALRWIGKLIDAGLLDRRPDDFDRRRAFLSLTPLASTAMHRYMAALARAGLTIA